MKNTILATLIISAVCILISCGGSSAANNSIAKAPGASSPTTGDSVYSGPNNFTYTINNRKVAIRDIMHNGDGKNWMALFLNEVTNNSATGMLRVNVTNQLTKEVFNFRVPATVGTTTITHSSPSLSGFANKKSTQALYMSPKYENYYGGNVIVRITAISATGAAGTFSGSFLSEDKPGGRQDISAGSFDLQFTKEKDN